MTTTDIRGYILHAPAKSGVGISLPDIYQRIAALAVFFMRKAQLHPNYGGLAGAEQSAPVVDR
ncbi:hypothetical protein K9D89_003914 [Salmonella enterica]|nr:hypothetical protein [Salmonella enterica]EJN0652699.1 hypothetical protein [Salmonella enterica]